MKNGRPSLDCPDSCLAVKLKTQLVWRMKVEKQLKMCWFNLSLINIYANGKAYINHGRKTPNPYCFLQLLSLAIKLIQPGEDKAQERSHDVCISLKGGCKKDGAGLFSLVPGARKRGTGCKLEHRQSPLNRGCCSRWPPEILSNLNCSIVLWKLQ